MEVYINVCAFPKEVSLLGTPRVLESRAFLSYCYLHFFTCDLTSNAVFTIKWLTAALICCIKLLHLLTYR